MTSMSILISNIRRVCGRVRLSDTINIVPDTFLACPTLRLPCMTPTLLSIFQLEFILKASRLILRNFLTFMPSSCRESESSSKYINCARSQPQCRSPSLNGLQYRNHRSVSSHPHRLSRASKETQVTVPSWSETSSYRRVSSSS